MIFSFSPGIASTLTALLFLCASSSQAQSPVEEKLLPLPVEVKVSPEQKKFLIQKESSLSTDNKDLQEATSFLGQTLLQGTSIPLALGKEDSGNIFITKAGPELAPYGDEAYKLSITPEKVTILVNSPKGVFYAGQTLAQLLPTAFYEQDKSGAKWELPSVEIIDYPHFSWRAFMLDDARYFWGEKEVYCLLDQMAQMKMNIFHWHLTNDSGWRIEIKKYPRLTEIGSKRKDSEIGTWGSGKTSGKPHGGFYTQEQIKKIVRYAAERNITIVPEVSMPGHCSAIVAAYPEFGTVKEPIEMPVKFGKLPSALDPTDERVYEFISDVFDEVIALFPSPVIHIGGDEVRFGQWDNSEAVKKLAKEKGFKNTNTDIQVYFTNRISQILEKKGKRMMGWNEILGHDLHGFNVESSTQSLAKDTIIHFWKGSSDLATSAIEKGHEVVNSTHSFTYLDYGYGSISLEKAYSFNPIFSGLDEKYHKKIMGLGAQAWTEWISDVDNLHSHIFPRLCAYAETGWTPENRKSYSSFKNRLTAHSKRMDAAGIGYAKNILSEITESDFFNAEKLAQWSPETLKSTPAEWDVSKSIKEKGTYKVSFFYNKGTNGIDIESVSLLVDGKEVAKDAHKGFSGGHKENITYTLQVPSVPSGAKVTLKAVLSGSAGNDSRGTIYLEKS